MSLNVSPNALLHATLDVVRNEFTKPPPKWHVTNAQDDIPFLIQECNQESEFDPHKTRQNMINRAKNGESTIQVMRCEYGQVLVVYHDTSQYTHVPWELWGRILRLYTETIKPSRAPKATFKPFKIFFLASPHLRLFPKKGPIEPQHINGGYTYPCNHETIMLYRAEDATRVLIHELMHSSCLDHMEQGVDQVEAETEAWAELIYIALLSRANTKVFRTLLRQQSDWICNQNDRVRRMIVDRQFPWRYTIGKEEVWERWGILEKQSNQKEIKMESLRLTSPPSMLLKKQFGVAKESMIL
jgi:hypothetical protein